MMIITLLAIILIEPDVFIRRRRLVQVVVQAAVLVQEVLVQVVPPAFLQVLAAPLDVFFIFSLFKKVCRVLYGRVD